MKKLLGTCLAVALFVGAFAQPGPADKGAKMWEKTKTHLIKEGLTAEEAEKIKPAYQTMFQEMKENRKQAHEKLAASVKTALPADKFAKWETWQKKHQEGMNHDKMKCKGMMDHDKMDHDKMKMDPAK